MKQMSDFFATFFVLLFLGKNKEIKQKKICLQRLETTAPQEGHGASCGEGKIHQSQDPQLANSTDQDKFSIFPPSPAGLCGGDLTGQFDCLKTTRTIIKQFINSGYGVSEDRNLNWHKSFFLVHLF